MAQIAKIPLSVKHIPGDSVGRESGCSKNVDGGDKKGADEQEAGSDSDDPDPILDAAALTIARALLDRWTEERRGCVQNGKIV